MDFFAFLTTWFWYVMAFAAGALVAWLVARQVIPAETPEEAVEDALDARFDDTAGRGDTVGRDDTTGGSRSRRTTVGDRVVDLEEGSDDDLGHTAMTRDAGGRRPATGGRLASLRRGATSLGGRR